MKAHFDMTTDLEERPFSSHLGDDVDDNSETSSHVVLAGRAFKFMRSAQRLRAPTYGHSTKIHC